MPGRLHARLCHAFVVDYAIAYAHNDHYDSGVGLCVFEVHLVLGRFARATAISSDLIMTGGLIRNLMKD